METNPYHFWKLLHLCEEGINPSPPPQYIWKKLTVINSGIKFGCITLEITFKITHSEILQNLKGAKMEINPKALVLTFIVNFTSTFKQVCYHKLFTSLLSLNKGKLFIFRVPLKLCTSYVYAAVSRISLCTRADIIKRNVSTVNLLQISSMSEKTVLQ